MWRWTNSNLRTPLKPTPLTPNPLINTLMEADYTQLFARLDPSGRGAIPRVPFVSGLQHLKSAKLTVEEINTLFDTLCVKSRDSADPRASSQSSTRPSSPSAGAPMGAASLRTPSPLFGAHAVVLMEDLYTYLTSIDENKVSAMRTRTRTRTLPLPPTPTLPLSLPLTLPLTLTLLGSSQSPGRGITTLI